MEAETKTMDAEPATTEISASEKLNYVSGATWKCQSCGLFNSISNWNCIACYASMKKSMQKDRSLIQPKNKYKGSNRNVHQERQAKRERLRAKNKTATNNISEAIEETKMMETEDEVKREPLKFKLSENIPKTMRALVKETAGKGYVLKHDYPVPTPAEDELLIRSFAVAICGSDNILYNWTKEAQTVAKLPFIPGIDSLHSDSITGDMKLCRYSIHNIVYNTSGHEACGLVVGVGRNCRFRIGERVAIENHFFCGECYQCKIGRKDICSNMGQFGHGKGTVYGGCCDYYIVKERYCYRLKADITWTEAAMLEPLGVAHNACENADLNGRAKGQMRETVMIVGCGPIGCMAIGVAKTMPVTGKIIACDVVDGKLAIARKMGADFTLNVRNLKRSLKEEILSLTDNVGVGRIIECSGDSKTISQLFGCLRKGGAITLVGLPKESLKIDNVLEDLIFKSIQIRSIHGRRIFRTWKKTERLVADKLIDLKPLVSHLLPLKDFEEGYTALANGTALKVVFDLTQ